MSSFTRKDQTPSQRGSTVSHSLQQCVRVLLLRVLAGSGDLLSVVLVAAVAVVVVAILTRGKWYLIVVFICSSPMISDVECCVTCLYYWQNDC